MHSFTNPPELRAPQESGLDNNEYEVTYRENGTVTIYTFKASDPERGTIYWSTSGADGSDFAISETGALTFTSPPDYEITSRVGP